MVEQKVKQLLLLNPSLHLLQSQSITHSQSFKDQVNIILAIFVEAFTTDSTLHSPNTSMNRHLVILILGFTKCFCANLTMIPCTCVLIHVNFVIVTVVMSFSTLFTVVYKWASVILHACLIPLQYCTFYYSCYTSSSFCPTMAFVLFLYFPLPLDSIMLPV